MTMPPERLPRPCRAYGCARTVTGRHSRCEEHRREQYRKETAARTLNPFYKSRLWLRARVLQIREFPLCQVPHCSASGRVVDHLLPISLGGPKLDPENFATMCDRCHNRKRSFEARNPQFFLDIIEGRTIYDSKDALLNAIFGEC